MSVETRRAEHGFTALRLAPTFASLRGVTCRMLWVTLALIALAGCGRSNTPSSSTERGDSLRFSIEEDTTGLTQGDALLTGFEVWRDRAGAVRARGRMELPDGARLQITLYRPGVAEMAARTQAVVRDRRFESAPIMAGNNGLPAGLYRIELVTYFDSAWQPPEVMTATRDGRSLRGPGVVRGNNGLAAFVHTEERRL